MEKVEEHEQEEVSLVFEGQVQEGPTASSAVVGVRDTFSLRLKVGAAVVRVQVIEAVGVDGCGTAGADIRREKVLLLLQLLMLLLLGGAAGAAHVG